MKVMAKIAKLPGGGYQAWCPALPGCKAIGPSPEEASRKICDAVKGYIASLDVALPHEADRNVIFSSVQTAA